MTPKKLAMILDGRDYKTRSFSSWINGDGHMKVVKTVKKFLLSIYKIFPYILEVIKIIHNNIINYRTITGNITGFKFMVSKGYDRRAFIRCLNEFNDFLFILVNRIIFKFNNKSDRNDVSRVTHRQTNIQY